MISENVGKVYTTNRALCVHTPSSLSLPRFITDLKAVFSSLPPIPHLRLIRDPSVRLPDQVQDSQLTLNFI